jgi:hypothetical protein
MIDLKKKCWREKITAEVTVTHLQQFAREIGIKMNAADAAVFLNEKGRAQAVWTYMMQAGEEFLKANLAGRTTTNGPSRSAGPVVSVHPVHRKQAGHASSTPVSYQ